MPRGRAQKHPQFGRVGRPLSDVSRPPTDLGDLSHLTRVDHVSLGPDSYPLVADDSHAFSSLPAERIALIAAYAPSLQVNAVRVADDGSLTELATTHLPRGGWNGEIVDATHL